MPRTTVLMPTRDGWPYLQQAVRSTLEDVQAVPDAELLVVDDGSTDESVAWLDDLAAENDRVRLVRTGGVGLAAALNTGLAAVDSEFVARMDADDVWIPGRLAKQLAAMTADDSLAAVGCQILRIIGDREMAMAELPGEHDEIVDGLLHGRHAVCHGSVMLRRSSVEAIDGYWSYGVAEDSDLFLRLSRVGRLRNLPFLGLKVRMHSSGINARRQYEVQLGMSYSAATYLRPRDEVTFDDFVRRLDARPLEKLDVRRRALGMSLYRDGLVDALAGGRRVLGGTKLASSMLLMPERALSRLARRA